MNLNNLLPSMASMPYAIRDLVGKVTNVVMNYTDAEIRVIDATNDDNWGAHGKLLDEIAEMTFMPNTYNETMQMVWQRLLVEGRRNWRRAYKSLMLLIHLLKHGSSKVLFSVRDRLDEINTLNHVMYSEENGRNTTRNVRNKVSELVALAQDDELLKQEREKAEQMKMKYRSVYSGSTEASYWSNSGFGAVSNNGNDIAGRWRSTNPGILEKLSDVTERVKEFMMEGGRISPRGYSDDNNSDVEDHEASMSHPAAGPLAKTFDFQIPSETRTQTGVGGDPIGSEIGIVCSQDTDEFADFQYADMLNPETSPGSVSHLIDLLPGESHNHAKSSSSFSTDILGIDDTFGLATGDAGCLSSQSAGYDQLHVDSAQNLSRLISDFSSITRLSNHNGDNWSDNHKVAIDFGLKTDNLGISDFGDFHSNPSTDDSSDLIEQSAPDSSKDILDFFDASDREIVFDINKELTTDNHSLDVRRTSRHVLDASQSNFPSGVAPLTDGSNSSLLFSDAGVASLQWTGQQSTADRVAGCVHAAAKQPNHSASPVNNNNHFNQARFFKQHSSQSERNTVPSTWRDCLDKVNIDLGALLNNDRGRPVSKPMSVLKQEGTCAPSKPPMHQHRSQSSLFD